MTVRLANIADLDRIMEIYARAQQFMRENGNPTQWSSTYPTRDLIEEDIAARISHVVTDNAGKIQGVFVFVIGKDSTYAVIRDGAWKSDAPYGTIHRIAASGETGGVFDTAVAYCKRKIGNLRIDTHENNRVMQHLITKNGFVYCGIIKTDNGTDRLAYQYTEN